MINERKFQFVHERIWEHLVKKIPNLKKSKVPVVVDKEVGISNAIKKIVPEMPILHCWNNIKDFKFWLGKQHVTSDEKLVYKNDLDTIMNSNNIELFNQNCDNLTAKWSQLAVNYFEKHIKEDFVKHSAKWVLKSYNLFNPYSGITNNTSEGMNTVIKRFMKWKEAPLDTVVLCLSYLQNYYWNELLRGFCDMGNYVLKTGFGYLVQSPSDLDFPNNICRPDLIIEKCQARVRSIVHENKDIHNEKKLAKKKPATLNQIIMIITMSQTETFLKLLWPMLL